MISYLTSSFYLATPFILAGAIVFSKYMGLKAGSKKPLSYDYVSIRRAGYYIVKLGALLAQAIGLAYLLKVGFALLVDMNFSYPLLAQSSIEIDAMPFKVADSMTGLAMLLFGGIVFIFANKMIRKLDGRKETYMDKMYSIVSKSVIAYLALIPAFFGIIETIVYFANEKYPAVTADAVGGQDVNIFQIIDFISGAGQTELLSVGGVNAPGVSLGLALALILTLLVIKMFSPVKFVMASKEQNSIKSKESTKTEDKEEKPKKVTKKKSSK